VNKEGLTAKDFIGHMLEAAERVLQYTKGMSREEFFASPLVQDAVIRNIEIIGKPPTICLRLAPILLQGIRRFHSRRYTA
jgi:uncharacterized protein with HEPN domain